MVTKMEDLPVEAQEELRDVRAQLMIEMDWPYGTHATTEQWREYYARLRPEAQAFLVDNLLDLAQTGSVCVQADHAQLAESSYQQLRGVVDLHNARVNEVDSLRRRMAVLESIITGDPEMLARAKRLEEEAYPAQVVDPQQDFLPVSFPNGPKDRVLYVVKNDPEVEDGD